MAEGGAALGKGAWDCDANKLIPPEKEVGKAASAQDTPASVLGAGLSPGRCGQINWGDSTGTPGRA